MRKHKEDYYLDIAAQVALRSTCLRRKYGAIIVKDDEIIATGYNGAPRGAENCIDINYCKRDELHIPSGERYELCRSVHAEANAIISAARRDMIGATLYLAGFNSKTGEPLTDTAPCLMCTRLIINAGIDRVICRRGKLQNTVSRLASLEVKAMFDEKTFCEGCKHHIREGACDAAGCVKIRGKFKATVVPDTNKRCSEIAKSCRNCGNRITDGGLYGLCKSHLSRTGENEYCSRWIPKKQDGK